MTNSVVANCVVLVSIIAVGAVGIPVKAGDCKGAFVAKVFVTVVEKLASFPNATANSFNVSNAVLAPATRLLISLFTNSVVATFLLLSATICVTAVKLPMTFKSLLTKTLPPIDKLGFNETSFVNVLLPLIIWSDVVFTTFTAVIVNNFLSLG